jgi:hypothetical protein
MSRSPQAKWTLTEAERAGESKRSGLKRSSSERGEREEREREREKEKYRHVCWAWSRCGWVGTRLEGHSGLTISRTGQQGPGNQPGGHRWPRASAESERPSMESQPLWPLSCPHVPSRSWAPGPPAAKPRVTVTSCWSPSSCWCCPSFWGL